MGMFAVGMPSWDGVLVGAESDEDEGRERGKEDGKVGVVAQAICA